jgi:hypothetical protein
MPTHLEEARTFDFHMNMWLLNMIVLGNAKDHAQEYRVITRNLKTYHAFARNSKLVKKKYRYAYYLFSLSPFLYKNAIALHSRVTQSEYGKRT